MKAKYICFVWQVFPALPQYNDVLFDIDYDFHQIECFLSLYVNVFILFSCVICRKAFLPFSVIIKISLTFSVMTLTFFSFKLLICLIILSKLWSRRVVQTSVLNFCMCCLRGLFVFSLRFLSVHILTLWCLKVTVTFKVELC